MRNEWPVENMLWVLTYQIGTNENRRSRTINFAALETAEKAQEVLGGSIEEYVMTSKVRQDSPADEFNRLYLCRFDSEKDMESLRKRHAEWSDRQFGVKRGPIGPLKHLALEAIEAAERPDDISEFADLIMLQWDVLRRSGFTRPMLCEAVRAKLEVNEKREWDVREPDMPCLHVK
ncbi:dATP/dGTP pyrophosphohydrolase domain-containing protein [Gibbsiella quercinecans]|uniref:dATP/dGTP pyrophosphohydrolase domain-containing protein n=1 Tax=Gibbsiella quercinecans TaxID=929813 RepID=UPI00242D838B|nr:dATP/dGTP pyrophosphohydrolase domain-containing protein [Gibbsiella quercinecans]